MNTSSIYHCLGLQDQQLLSTSYVGDTIQLKVKTKKDKLRCSRYKRMHVICCGVIERSFKGPMIGKKKCVIIIDIQRLYCKKCKIVRQEHLRFAKEQKSYIRSLEKMVLLLSSHMTIQSISRLLDLNWNIVKDIIKSHLKSKCHSPGLKGVKHIAIDEFAVRKGHVYMTCVYDLDKGVVLHVGKGKGSESLVPFWKRIKINKVQIESVAIDMSAAYILSVKTNAPKATMVFDHFHIIKKLNETISKIRRDLYNKEKDEVIKKSLKGSRWLLLKNPDNLNLQKGEDSRLEKVLETNTTLFYAYYLKEELRELWNQDNIRDASKLLKQWIEEANETEIPQLKKMVELLTKHKTGILNWYKCNISTGPLEGINNKIKTLKRQAYGYRDLDFFMLKIKAMHQDIYAKCG
ncbi:ISL3 family transposase [Halosquirtibacter laminarini]|uniref:ISL3 family transposase n=1 Tax=Halosquirtibacter laminarini TaxID=3374600 RepID=A0AC61NMW6_9BACT|nr:ISL3 family transposase [Prolixibacteraceae bacterium]